MLSTSLKKLVIILALTALAFAQNPTNIDTQVKGSRWPAYSTDSGAANAYVLTTFAPLGPSLRTGSVIIFKAANTNSGASTATVDGSSAKPIKVNGTTALIGGEIAANGIYTMVYDGTNFQLQGNTSISGGSLATTYRTCTLIFGADNGASLVNADIGPQGRQCFVPYNATVQEIEVAADAGTPSVIVAVKHGGSASNLLSSGLATAGSGGIACSNTGGTLGFDGATTCSGTLQNTSIAQGDYVEAVSGTASTAKRLSVFVTWSQPSFGTGGTVTSIAIAFPSGFSCSGPVTSAGTLTCGWSVAAADQPLISTGANAAAFQAAIGTCGDGTHALKYTAGVGFGCQTISVGTGTATSVALALPSGFSVSGSPVTTSGTLTGAWSVAGADRVILSTAANTAGFSAAISTCGDGTHALNYDATAHAFGCQTLTGGGSGTVTTFSAGTLLPLFTTSVATATTTPALTFVLSNAAANTIFGNFTGSSAGPSFNAMSACGDSSHALNWTAGTGFGCQAISAGSGTVTSVATSSPITGGTITTTGTIACATCVTSAASLTSNQLMTGAGSQASQTLGSLGTTTTVLHGNAAGAPTFGAVSLTADVSGTLPIANGGTGATTLAAHGVVVGNTTSAVNVTAAGTSGQCFTSNGASADPTYQTCGISGNVTGPAYDYFQCSNSVNGSGTTIGCSSTINVASGNAYLLFCEAFTNDGGTITFSASDSLTSTWGTALSAYSSTVGSRNAAFWAVPSSTGADSFTCTFSAAATFSHIVVVSVVGMNASSPVDVTGSKQGTGSTMLGAALTTTSDGDLIFIYGAASGSQASANFLGGANLVQGATPAIFLGVKKAFKAGLYTPQVFTSGSGWSNIAIAMKQ